jgi:hypothetical protein
MADVASTLAAWSSTDASNSPSGATPISTGLDDNLRALQAVIVRGLSHKGSDIASTTTTDVGAVEGLMNDITGDETVTGFGTVRSGILKVLKFEGAVTLTHNTTSLILPGAANITTADGDVGIFISEGSGNWRCLSYVKAAGGVLGPVLGTEQATTSGTSIDFTGIPSWAKKITVQLVGVSTSGTSSLILQIGDSGGIENSGYLGAASAMGNGAATVAANFTTGFGVSPSVATDSVFHGRVALTLEDAANFTWVSATNLAFSNGASSIVGAGSKSLSAALDRVRLTTSGGADTFDAGAVNILYE